MIAASIISSVRGNPFEWFDFAGTFSSEVEPVRVRKTRQMKNPEPRFDSIEAE
jgi:hypothetical protein